MNTLSATAVLVAILFCSPSLALSATIEITDVMVDASADLAGINGGFVGENSDSRVRGGIVQVRRINELVMPGDLLTFERSGAITGAADAGFDDAFDTAFNATVTVQIPTLSEIAQLSGTTSPFFSTTTFVIPAEGFLTMRESVFSASGELTQEFATSQPLAADGVADLVAINGVYRVTGFSLATTNAVSNNPVSPPTTPTSPTPVMPVITSGGVSLSPIIPPFTSATAPVPEPGSLAVWMLLLAVLPIARRGYVGQRDRSRTSTIA